MRFIGEQVKRDIVSVGFKVLIVLVPRIVTDCYDRGHDAGLLIEILHRPFEVFLIFNDPEIVFNNELDILVLKVRYLFREINRLDSHKAANSQKRPQKHNEEDCPDDYMIVALLADIVVGIDKIGLAVLIVKKSPGTTKRRGRYS